MNSRGPVRGISVRASNQASTIPRMRAMNWRANAKEKVLWIADSMPGDLKASRHP